MLQLLQLGLYANNFLRSTNVLIAYFISGKDIILLINETDVLLINETDSILLINDTDIILLISDTDIILLINDTGIILLINGLENNELFKIFNCTKYLAYSVGFVPQY